MSTWASIAASNLDKVQIEKDDQIPDNSRIAIVDATALIKGFPLDTLYDFIYTVKEVFNEIRDKSARHRLQNTPYKIQTLEPEPEAIKTGNQQNCALVCILCELNHIRIVNFARGTGDLDFLSTADIKLIALVFEFEKRVHGTDHLLMTPKRVVSVKTKPAGKQTELPGWGNTPNPEDWEFIDHLDESQLTKLEENQSSVEISQIQDHSKPLFSSPDDGWTVVVKRKKQQKKKVVKTGDCDEEGSGFESRVCCLTGDFGIQNVLLQMGLKLVTPDGVRIRHVTQWGLKCASCFHTTKKSGIVFCPNCGNSTLFKVRIEVDENGVEVYGGLSKPQQRRGAKCSIPPPKGGKNNKDAIVSEDMMRQAMLRFRNVKTSNGPDIMDPEYDEETWFKTRTIKNEIKDQLPGRFGYPRFMSKSSSHRRKH
eukprot:g6259.t1